MAIDEVPNPAVSGTLAQATGAGDTRRMRGPNSMGMRQFNERIVLQVIRHNGAIAKADLARITHLSSQTVAVIVGRLLEDGLLIKQDRVRGRIDQPSVPLSLNPKGAYSIGVQSLTIMDSAYAAYTGPWLEQSASALVMTVTSAAALLDLDAVVLDGALGGASLPLHSQFFPDKNIFLKRDKV
jgi:hypothetical protein